MGISVLALGLAPCLTQAALLPVQQTLPSPAMSAPTSPAPPPVSTALWTVRLHGFAIAIRECRRERYRDVICVGHVTNERESVRRFSFLEVPQLLDENGQDLGGVGLRFGRVSDEQDLYPKLGAQFTLTTSAAPATAKSLTIIAKFRFTGMDLEGVGSKAVFVIRNVPLKPTERPAQK